MLLVMALCVIATVPQGPGWPTPRVVPQEPACARCRIALRPVTVLGARGGRGGMAVRPYSIAAASRGRFVVAVSPERPRPPLVFSADGSYEGELGRVGSGPGEYRSPRLVTRAPGDTLLVFDEALGRLTVLSPSLRPVRSSPAPHDVWSAAADSTGSLLVNANVRDRARIGVPLHLFSRDGSYRRSFGDEHVPVLPSSLSRTLRWVAPSEPGRFWSLRESYRYRLEEWDTAGSLRQVLDRDPSWFLPYTERRTSTPTRPPSPYTTGLWRDSSGLLWVAVAVPSRTWAAGLGPARLAERQSWFPERDPHRVWDTVIDVIDPQAGRLVATMRLPGRYDLVAGPGLLGRVIEDPVDGWFLVQVFRVTLDR